MTALHRLTEHITKGFNDKRPPLRTVTIALDMSKAFDTVNLHTLTDKLLRTDTPTTMTKYIANYIKGRKGYKHSFKKQFKTGVPQGGVLSPTLFNIYTSDIPDPPQDVHIITYADDITLFSSDKDHHTVQRRLQPYLDTIVQWTKDSDLIINADKTMTTLFTPDPAEYSDTLTLTIDQTTLPTTRTPKILGLTFDPKMTFSSHIKQTTDKAKRTLNILKALTSTTWGKTKETLTTTYKTVTRPILEYASTVWSPMVSKTQIQKLQTVQNAALRVATGCTADTNYRHLHDETRTLPIDNPLRLHSSQTRAKAAAPDHPLNDLTN